MQATPVRTVLAASLAAAFAAWAPTSDARVTRIIIDSKVDCVQFDNPPPPAVPKCIESNYDGLIGRAFGELDPNDDHNALITDVQAAAHASPTGKAQYIASFYIVKPKDTSTLKPSGLLWHDVPNRGGRITITSDLRTQGDIGISSGWQGDNAGATAVPANASSLTPVTPSTNEWVQTPKLVGQTGMILG